MNEEISLSSIVRTETWPLPPAPPEVRGVPFDWSVTPRLGLVIGPAGRVGAALGFPRLAAAGPQIALGVGVAAGVLCIRHGYRVVTTRPDRLEEHRRSLVSWRNGLPPVRALTADGPEAIERIRAEFRRGEHGAGTTVTLPGPFGQSIQKTFSAACVEMKRLDRFRNVKRIATVLSDLHAVAGAITESGFASPKVLRAINNVRRSLLSINKAMNDDYWDSAKYQSEVMADLMLEFVANGALVVGNDGREVRIRLGHSSAYEYGFGKRGYRVPY